MTVVRVSGGKIETLESQEAAEVQAAASCEDEGRGTSDGFNERAMFLAESANVKARLMSAAGIVVVAACLLFSYNVISQAAYESARTTDWSTPQSSQKVLSAATATGLLPCIDVPNSVPAGEGVRLSILKDNGNPKLTGEENWALDMAISNAQREGNVLDSVHRDDGGTRKVCFYRQNVVNRAALTHYPTPYPLR